MAAVAGICLACVGGCPDAGPELEKDFRAAAAGTMEAGLKQIADGWISGMFAIFEPEDSTGDTSTTSTASETTE